MSMRRRLTRAFPPIAWRDDALAERRDQLNALRREHQRLQAEHESATSELRRARRELRRKVDVDEYLAHPSFRRQLVTLRRTSVDLRSVDPGLTHPLRHLPFKLRNYRVAASHGYAVPAVLATWANPAEIEVAGLPDAVVLKSDGGAGSHGVLPLRRTGPDAWTTVDGDRTLSADGVREHFVSRVERRSISGPFFAEEFLEQPGGGPIPDDIKVYATYGQVQQVLLRRVDRHGDLGQTRRRYLGADGTDLGDVAVGEKLDHTIPVPSSLPQVVQLVEHLSRAVGVPFVRVDLYETARGLVVGELTRSPGGKQQMRDDHDQAMGLAWERAAYRLDLDLIAGRPPGVLHGTHPAPNLYPEGHVSRSAEPGPWEPTVVPCEQWCRPSR